jgi:hypothetical protein
MDYTIRDAIHADAAGILPIYNHAALNTTAIWNDNPSDLSQGEAWLADTAPTWHLHRSTRRLLQPRSMLGENSTKEGRHPPQILRVLVLRMPSLIERRPIPDRTSVEINVPIEDLEDTLPSWIRVRTRAKVLERLKDNLHEREALVIAQFPALVRAEKFV